MKHLQSTQSFNSIEFKCVKKSTISRLVNQYNLESAEIESELYLICAGKGLDITDAAKFDRIAGMLANKIRWSVPAGCRFYVEIEDADETQSAFESAFSDPLAILIERQEQAERDAGEVLNAAKKNEIGFALAQIQCGAGGVVGRKELAKRCGVSDRQLRNRLVKAEMKLGGVQSTLSF